MNILVIMAKASKLHQEWLSLWCLQQGVQGVHDIIMQLIPLNYIPQKILTWPFKTHPDLILPINIEVNNKKKQQSLFIYKGWMPRPLYSIQFLDRYKFRWSSTCNEHHCFCNNFLVIVIILFKDTLGICPLSSCSTERFCYFISIKWCIILEGEAKPVTFNFSNNNLVCIMKISIPVCMINFSILTCSSICIANKDDDSYICITSIKAEHYL